MGSTSLGIPYLESTDPPSLHGATSALALATDGLIVADRVSIAVNTANAKRSYTTGVNNLTSGAADLVVATVTIPTLGVGVNYKIKTEFAGVLLMASGTGVDVYFRNQLGGARIGRIARFGNGFLATANITAACVDLTDGPFTGATVLELFADWQSGGVYNAYDASLFGGVVTAIPI